MSGHISTPGLHVAGLRVTRGGRCVLRDVSVQAQRGEVVALVGPNGAGKSSLLQAVLGRLPATGSVTMAGIDVLKLAPTARARCVAYVPQRSQLRAPLSVRRVVATGRYAHGPVDPGASAAVTRALTRMAITDLADRAFTAVSCGEQQRVLIARALASEAEVILLDEPTAGLDPLHALTLLATLRRLAAAGRIVVVALHHLDEVRRVADRVVVLQDGAVVADDVPDVALAATTLRQVYGVEPDPAGGFAVRVVGD